MNTIAQRQSLRRRARRRPAGDVAPRRMAVTESASRSDIGGRPKNEDAHLARPPLFAVADGVSGGRAGAAAAELAVAACLGRRAIGSSPEEHLADLTRAANSEVNRLRRVDWCRGMATTLTCALVEDCSVAIAHVGDTRAFMLRDSRLETLTTDHTVVAELVRRGDIDAGDASLHPMRGKILRALGSGPELEVDTRLIPALPGDVFLVCSDGLSAAVPEAQIEQLLASGGPLADRADALIREARRAGSSDNATVVLFKLGAPPS